MPSVQRVLVHFIDKFQVDIRGDKEIEHPVCLFSLFYKSRKCYFYCEFAPIKVDT